jgi:hypothetical protein
VRVVIAQGTGFEVDRWRSIAALNNAALRRSDSSPEIEFSPMISSIQLSGDAVDRLEMLTS